MRHSTWIGMSLILAGLTLCATSSARAEPQFIPQPGNGYRVSPYYPYGTYYYNPYRYFYAPRVVYTSPRDRYLKQFTEPSPATRDNTSVILPEKQVFASRAKIRVHVPDGAVVHVQGERLPLTVGTERVYLTEPLEPGRNYYYVVKARYRVGSLSYAQQDIVDIRAGEQVHVDFLGRVPKDPTIVPTPIVPIR